MKHYPFGGSTADRTLACPAWRTLADQMPEPVPSSYAEEGTALHEVMDSILNCEDSSTDENPYAYQGSVINSIVITEDHVQDKIVPALDAFNELCAEYGLTEYESEITLIDREHNDIGGTADVIAWGGDCVAVIDWKFGEGVQVQPKNLGQGLFYALLADNDNRFADIFNAAKTLLIVIIQPNSRGEETLRVWETPLNNALAYFGVEFDKAIAAAKADDPKPKAGDHCQFCPAIPICPTKTGLEAKARRMPVDGMTAKKVTKALHLVDELEVYCKGIRDFAHTQAELGVKIKGFKLVAKRATRKWHDEAGALNKVRLAKKLHLEHCTKTKLLSPTQLDKFCNKAGVDFKPYLQYFSKTSSGTTLVPEDDPRQEFLSPEGLKAFKDSLS